MSPCAASPVHLDPPGPEPVDLGRFGEFGGRFVPETLVPALEELEREFRAGVVVDAFRAEFAGLLSELRGPADAGHRVPSGCRSVSGCGSC